MANVTVQVTIAGNLTRDPELRYGSGGQAVVRFSIATTPRSFNRETKEYEDGEAIFTNCVLWGKPAENLAASVSKGTRVIASGHLKSRTFTNRAGDEQTITELTVDEIGASLMFTTMNAQKGAGGPARKSDYPAETGNDGWNQQSAGDDIPF